MDDDCIAQDEGEWRKTAKQGTERLMVKWIAAEKAQARLQHAIVCPKVTGRTKTRVAQSKRARTGSLVTGDKPLVARTSIPVLFANKDILTFAGVAFFSFFSLFFFFFFFFLFRLFFFH